MGFLAKWRGRWLGSMFAASSLQHMVVGLDLNLMETFVSEPVSLKVS